MAEVTSPRCPSCRFSGCALPVKALTPNDLRKGFEVAKALKAPPQVAAFHRCARCGAHFDENTKVGGIK